MVQKLIINVDANKPLDSYGEGHMLIYDAAKKQYFVTSREALLSPQNNKIKELEAKLEKFVKLITEQEEKLKISVKEKIDKFEKKVDEEIVVFEKKVNCDIKAFADKETAEIKRFENKMGDNFQTFLETYQKTNSKLIKMVKNVISEEI